MLQNYFKIGWRNLLRSKSYSFINITGLAAGISSCLLIVLYISDELGYDRYHEKADRIHRVAVENLARTPAAAAPAMLASYPHLAEQAVRFWPLFASARP
ncbi:MAG: ABC transporter permease [Cyclobacteriaceae bacterium]